MSDQSPAAPTAADEATSSPELTDVIHRFRGRMLRVLLEFGDAVLDEVRDAKGIDVEDLRHRILHALRREVDGS